MSVLKKNWKIDITPGTPGIAGTTGTVYQPGYWTESAPEPAQKWNTYIPPVPAEPSIRLATYREVRLLFPWLKTDCEVEIQILKGTMTTETIGIPLYLFTDSYGRCTSYLTICGTSHNGTLGIAYCVVTGSPGSITPFHNPAYTPGWEYTSGDIPGC